MRGRLGPMVWVIGLGAVAAALHVTGGGPLAPPPLTDPGRWGAWLEGRQPVVAAFSLLRMVALAGLWYVVLATLVGTALRVAGATSLVRLADRVTIGPVRRLLAGSVSLGLDASGVVAVAAPALRTPVAAAQPATTSTTPTTAAVTPATVTMHRLSPTEPPPAPATPAIAPAPQIGSAAETPDRWRVKPGECFWSIAESVLTERWGRSPSDAEIVPYWQRLIDANRHELANRHDPHLIFPGQVFVVPAP